MFDLLANSGLGSNLILIAGILAIVVILIIKRPSDETLDPRNDLLEDEIKRKRQSQLFDQEQDSVTHE